MVDKYFIIVILIVMEVKFLNCTDQSCTKNKEGTSCKQKEKNRYSEGEKTLYFILDVSK